MPDLTDQKYLLTDQYRDASNLNARIRLHELFSVNPQGMHEWTFDQFDLPEGARVLELGCGPGTMWVKNAERVLSGWDVTLSDFSPGMLDEARRNLANIPHPFTFLQIDAQSIALPDASFDAVIANYMLYHVPNRPAAFSEIARVLRPGGRLYAATLGQFHMNELDELGRKVVPGAEAVVGGSLVHPFSLENGAEQLAPYFYHIETRRYQDALRVTVVEPLIAYVLSSRFGQALTPEQIEQFAVLAREEIRRDGLIPISKDSGMFIATKV